MEKKKLSMNGIVVCVFEIVVGVLLILNPTAFTNAIVMGAGLVLLAIGVINVVKYFKEDPAVAAKGHSLMLGLGALTGGVVCLIKHGWIVATLSLLTIVYGVFVFASGLEKIQTAVDLIRVKNKSWILPAIGAAISIICAIIIVCNPFATAKVVWMFIGITLLVQAVFDVMVIISKKKTQ